MSKIDPQELNGWMIVGWQISAGARAEIYAQNINEGGDRATISLAALEFIQFEDFGLESSNFQIITSVSFEDRSGDQTITLHFGDTFISVQCREVEVWSTGSPPRP